MPIVIDDAPDGLFDLVEAGLTGLPPVTEVVEEVEGADDAQVAQLYRPLPVFGATLYALARQVSEARLPLEQIAWRVLVDERSTLSIAEIGVIDGEPAMTSLWRGAVAEQLARASAAAQDMVDEGRLYRARIIALPEVGLAALWLHADHEHDLVVRLEEGAGAEPIAIFAAEARRRAQPVRRTDHDFRD